MAQSKEEQVRLIKQRSQQAISLAMEGRWKEAVEANREIVEDFPADVDAWNRLGRAYMEMGDIQQARDAYTRAKELDPYNAIADKNLRRLANLKEATPARVAVKKVAPQVFISIFLRGFWSKLTRTIYTLHSSPSREQAKARALPHWPAPVSVVSFLIPNSLLYQAWATAVFGL